MISNEVISLLHESIDNNRLDEVKKIISRNQNECYYFNSEMVSAAAAAIKAENFEIYDYLISEGVRCGSHEHFSEISKGTTRMKLRDINKKYFKPLERSHLEVLLSKCRIGHNADEGMGLKYGKLIADAFSDLNDLAIIEPILKVLSQADISIVFDFDRNSVDHLDPTKNKLTIGATYFHNGLVYIGAKKLLEDDERLEVLATMAHELCHYALNMIYNNFCSPYLPDDENTRLKFDVIVDSCKSNVDKEHLMKEVFQYSHDKIHSELIVCVPQLTVVYKEDEQFLLRCRSIYNELFNFFEEKTLVDVKREYPRLEAMRKVRELNHEFGTLYELKKLSSHLKEKSSSFDPSKCDEFEIISSNCPQLTMASIYKGLCTVKHFESFYLFLNLSQFQNSFESILDAYDLCMKPTLIIDCGSQSSEEIIEVYKKISIANLRKQNLLVINEDIARSILDNGINVIPSKHSWSDLKDEFQNEILTRNVLFQGRTLPLNEIIDPESIIKIEENLPLEKLLSNDILCLQQENKFPQIEFYIERRFFKDDSENLMREERTTIEVIECLENGNIIVLPAEPGMGKTTELQKIAKHLEYLHPFRWISFIDLQSVELSLESNQVFDSCAKILKFLSENILKLKSFESEVFKHLFINDRIIFLFDGFDEIKPSSRQLLLELLVAISSLSKNLLLISTRPHLTKNLKLRLKPILICLKGFSEIDRKDFIAKIISTSFQYTESDRKLNKIESFFTKSEKNLFQNPSLIRIIVDIMINCSLDFDNSESNDFEVYNQFVMAIIERYMDKGVEARKSVVRYFGNNWINELYQRFAVKSFLSIYNEKVLDSISISLEDVQSSHKEHIYRAGMMYHEDPDGFKFIHSSFAEYFACKFMIDKIFNRSVQSDEELDFVISMFISVTTMELRSNLIIRFLNYALEPFVSQNNLLKSTPNIEKLLSCFVTQLKKPHFLHQLIQNQGLHIIELLTLHKGFDSLFDEKDHEGNNILFTAAGCLAVEDFEKLCTIITNYLGSSFLINNLCEENSRRERLFLNALKNEDHRVFKFLCNSNNVVGNSIKLNNISFHSAIQDIKNNFEAIINCINVENYEIFLEILGQYNDLKSFFQTVNIRSENILHMICLGPDVKKLEISFKLLEKTFSNDELTKIVLAQCVDGETTLMKASRNINVKIIQTLLNFLDKLLPTENQRKTLLMKNKIGWIALHFAVQQNNEDIFSTLFDAYRRLFTIYDLKKILRKKFAGRNFAIFALEKSKSIRTLLLLLGLMEQIYLRHELKEILISPSEDGTILRMINDVESSEIKTWFDDHLGVENEAKIIDLAD